MNELDKAKVGDGATYRIWSDCLAGTIIERTGKKIVWQRDKATLLNGFKSGAADALTFTPGGFAGHTEGRQRYEYARDPEGVKHTFTKRNNGEWKLVGSRTREPGAVLSAGRHEYYDFNF